MITVQEYQQAFIKHAASVRRTMERLRDEDFGGMKAELNGGIAMLSTMIDSLLWQLAQKEETLVFGLPPVHDETQFPPAD